MNISHIPFYIPYQEYLNFIKLNFPTLILSDDTLFLGFIILNISMIFCIFLLIKIIKFVVILGKNLIFR